MYKSTWGVQFVEGTCVTLHPDGLKTYEIPGLLTSATPSHTFKAMTHSYYDALEDENKLPHKKHFTITCWFYWPLTSAPLKHNVLVQSSGAQPQSQIYFECEGDQNGTKDASSDQYNGKWTLMSEDGRRQPLQTPRLS